VLTKETILQFLTENKDFIGKQFHVSKIGLFGSYARNEQAPESDIDILIEMEDASNNIFERKWALREFLQTHFKREIDICNIRHIKHYAKDYILKDAIYA
jgi:hypothetical protein